jgi:hypothetical protein
LDELDKKNLLQASVSFIVCVSSSYGTRLGRPDLLKPSNGVFDCQTPAVNAYVQECHLQPWISRLMAALQWHRLVIYRIVPLSLTIMSYVPTGWMVILQEGSSRSV